MSHSLSLDLSAEIADIDAGLSADVAVDAGPPPVAVAAAESSPLEDEAEPAWNNTRSCVRTQRHVMRHRRSQRAVAFCVDAVVAGDRPAVTARAAGLRETLSELLIRSALHDDVESVSGLVSCQYVHVDVADRTGNTALHCASVSHSRLHSLPGPD